MANRVVASKELRHYYDDCCVSSNPIPIPEPDKTKSISDLSNDELRRMISRLRDEREAEDMIRQLRRSAGEPDTYEKPAKIDTNTPINQMYHHGVKGQHWGVRRFQNEDGTRTAAGKKRDEDSTEKVKSEDYVKSRRDKAKSPDGLSNDDLKKLNERLRLESDYKNLTAAQVQKSNSFVEKALRDAGSQALTEFSKGVMLGGAKILVKELSPTFAETAFGMKDQKPKK